jgi:O-antigen/teichoic acid export membrane protein
MTRHKEIVKDMGFYTLATYGAQVFDLVNGIFVRRFLGPASMGVWTFLQVVLNYAKHASLGTTMATARDVPYFIGKGEVQKADEIKDLVFTFTVLTAVLTALGVVIFAWMRRRIYGPEIFFGLIVIAGLIVLQRVYNLYIVLLRAFKQFVTAGVINFVSSAASVLFTITLVWKFGLYGLFASILLNYFFLIGWIHVFTPYRFRFSFSVKKMMPIWAFGGSMLVTDILNTVQASVDRIMITKYLGFEALGIYSIGLMAFNYVNSVPTMLAVVLFPHFQELYSKDDDPANLGKMLHQSTFALVYLFPVIIGLVWIISIYFVPIILPKYAGGIPALRYLCLTSFFLGLRHSFNTFIVTVKKHWWLVPMNIVMVLAAFALTGFFLYLGWGIDGVALAACATAALNFFAFSWFSMRHLERRESFGFFYLKIMGVFIYFGGLLFALDAVLLKNEAGWLRAIAACSLYLVLMSPLLFLAEKELKILSLCKEVLTAKLRGKNKRPPDPETRSPEVGNCL